MSAAVGDGANVRDADYLVGDWYDNADAGISYQPLAAGLVAKARTFLEPHLAVAKPRHHRWSTEQHKPLHALGRHAAARMGLCTPEEVLVNINAGVAYHYDRTAPYTAINVVVLLRYLAAGGQVVFPQLRLGFMPRDGWALAFDGKAHLHGVTDVEPGAGYRASLVYYCRQREPRHAPA